MPSTANRPQWHHIRVSMARIIAQRSLCVRDQVGAIVVDAENKVIGEGYNGPARYTEHGDRLCDQWCPRSKSNVVHLRSPEYYDCPSLHAEANALMVSDRSLRVGGTIYITSHPCMACAKLIANSGLTGVYVGHDGTHEYRRDPAVYGYLMNLGLRVWEVAYGPTGWPIGDEDEENA